MSRHLIPYVGIGLAALALAVPAAAQNPAKGEISGGYQYQRIEGDSLSKGWYVDLGWNKNERLAIVGQVTGSYKPATRIPFGRLTLTLTESVYELLLGLRLRSRANSRVVPFGHVLVGSGGTSSSASLGGDPFESSSSGFALLLLGGGVNLGVTDRIGIRAGADYGLGFSMGGGGVFRLGLGLNIPF